MTTLPQTKIVFLGLGLGLYDQRLTVEHALTLEERDLLFKTLFNSLPLTKIKTFGLNIEPSWHPFSSQTCRPDLSKAEICVPENDVYLKSLSQFLKEQNINRIEKIVIEPLIWKNIEADKTLRRYNDGFTL